MKYKFFKNVICEVPVDCLIEDVQSLRMAVSRYLNSEKSEIDADQLLEEINTTIDCLEGNIDSFTKVPDGLNVVPSGSTLVCKSHSDGIILQEDGSDILCANGVPISHAMSGGCCQCEDCGRYSKCFDDYDLPKNGRVLPYDMVNQKQYFDETCVSMDTEIIDYLNNLEE